METRGRGEKKEEGAEGGKVDTQGLHPAANESGAHYKQTRIS